MATRRRSKGTGNLVERAEGRWLIRIDHGRNAVTGRRDRRSYLFVGSKQAAQRKMNELLRERDQGTSTPPDRVTVAEWLPGWLERHFAESKITERIRIRYRGIITHHIIPTLGHVRLQALRATDIADLKTRWLTGGEGSTSKRPLSAATVYKHLMVLSQALEEAVQHNILARNPAAAVSKPSVTSRREQRSLTEDEIGDLLKAVAKTRFNVPVRITLSTGLRQAEMLELTWAGIDFDQGVINVKGTKTANSRRQVELSAAMVKLLRAHRQEQRERRMKLGAGWQEHGLVFPCSSGAPWNRRIFYRDYKVLVNGSEVPDPNTVTWHILRHTAASLWIRHGADIFTVSRRLGHASAAFTMDVYAHLLKGQQRVAAEALDHLLA